MTALDGAFALCGGVATAAALSAVLTRHVVHSALWLVTTLVGVAGALLVLGGELPALVVVLVYVGAVVVLVLFALMLTRAPIGPDLAHEVTASRKAGAALAGAATTALLLTVLVPLARSRTVSRRPVPNDELAARLFDTWVWPLELLSLLLLAALVAALAVSRSPSPGPGPVAGRRSTRRARDDGGS